MKARDRDAPVTREGIIFRVMGYNHPPGVYFCDVEYAPETIYISKEKRALREGRGLRYYKFYFDGGLKFVEERYPQYTVYSRVFGKRFVGLKYEYIAELRKPEERLQKLLMTEKEDKLLKALRRLLDIITEISTLKTYDFGVFGSLMHDFYHEEYSDLDLVIYGTKELEELLEVLNSLYRDGRVLINEFDTVSPEHFMNWRFKYLTPKEYIEYQKRKMIYAIYKGPDRQIKVEFEPVMRWEEIVNEYPKYKSIRPLTFVEAEVKVINASRSYFMPSTYSIELLKLKGYSKPVDVRRVISYVEEFRMQLGEGDLGLVRGMLEEVCLRNGEIFHQIVLSYFPKIYHEQVLKPLTHQ